MQFWTGIFKILTNILFQATNSVVSGQLRIWLCLLSFVYFLLFTIICLLYFVYYQCVYFLLFTFICLLSFVYFRIYNITEPDEPEQVIPLADYPDSFSLSASRSTFRAALGENTVSFDFGPPTELKTQPARGGKSSKTELAWPVYLLKGNGDVYSVMTVISKRWDFLTKIHFLHFFFRIWRSPT